MANRTIARNKSLFDNGKSHANAALSQSATKFQRHGRNLLRRFHSLTVKSFKQLPAPEPGLPRFLRKQRKFLKAKAQKSDLCRLSHASNSGWRSEEHTSELQSRENLVCR